MWGEKEGGEKERERKRGKGGEEERGEGGREGGARES